MSRNPMYFIIRASDTYEIRGTEISKLWNRVEVTYDKYLNFLKTADAVNKDLDLVELQSIEKWLSFGV